VFALLFVVLLGVFGACKSDGENADNPPDDPPNTDNPSEDTPSGDTPNDDSSVVNINVDGAVDADDIIAAIQDAIAASGGSIGEGRTVKVSGIDLTSDHDVEELFYALSIGLPTGEISLDLSGCFGASWSYKGSIPASDKERRVDITFPSSVMLFVNGGDTCGAFEGFDGLRSVSAPNVIYIGKWAFQHQVNLGTVNLPSAQIIREYAFDNCDNLQTVSLPVAQVIEKCAFYSCDNLQTVSLPAALIFEDNAFTLCTSISSVALGPTPPTMVEVYVLTLFRICATTQKTITFYVPNVSVYIAAGTPWSDKMGNTSVWGTYWDNFASTKDNLTVAIAQIP
jgi:hypothetical protein